MSFLPKNYEAWRHCIEVKCNISLTQPFVAERLDALKDQKQLNTQKFINRWGDTYHAQTVAWFEQAAKELEAS